MDVAGKLLLQPQPSRRLRPFHPCVLIWRADDGRETGTGLRCNCVGRDPWSAAPPLVDAEAFGLAATTEERAVDAIAAIIDAEIGQQDFQQRNAAPVRRIGISPMPSVKGQCRRFSADRAFFAEPRRGCGRRPYLAASDRIASFSKTVGAAHSFMICSEADCRATSFDA